MAKVRKLTPRRLKRIIEEEKRRLRISKPRPVTKSKPRTRKKKHNSSSSVVAQIRALAELKRRETKAAKRLKRIYEARKLIKKELIRRL